MQFPSPTITGLDDVQYNIDFLKTCPLTWGNGAPAFLPPNGAVTFYLRKDTPTVANQRIYIFNGTAWVGIV